MRALFSSTLPLLLILGCAHEKPVVKAPTGAGGAGGPSSAQAIVGDAPKDASCSGDSACANGLICVEGKCVAVADHLDACVKQRLHFAFDQALVDPADLPSLQRAARCLRADHAMHLTIEGDADERGTDEYNMALGDRRAVEVAKYLKDLGVSEAQLRTVSYGKEKPLCAEHDEECWSRNRRADLNVTQGGSKAATPK